LHALAQKRCGLTSVLGGLADTLPFLVCLHRASLLILPHGLLPRNCLCDYVRG
jgi:hypothetical protein